MKSIKYLFFVISVAYLYCEREKKLAGRQLKLSKTSDEASASQIIKNYTMYMLRLYLVK